MLETMPMLSKKQKRRKRAIEKRKAERQDFISDQLSKTQDLISKIEGLDLQSLDIGEIVTSLTELFRNYTIVTPRIPADFAFFRGRKVNENEKTDSYEDLIFP